jgi:hypothetical protein
MLPLPSPLPEPPAHRCECAAAWACVGLAAGWWWHDAPVGHQHHVLATELLLQLTHQPLLDLVEQLQQAEGPLGPTMGTRGGGAAGVELQATRVLVQFRGGCSTA